MTIEREKKCDDESGGDVTEHAKPSNRAPVWIEHVEAGIQVLSEVQSRGEGELSLLVGGEAKSCTS
jgi:hypothetical protein